MARRSGPRLPPAPARVARFEGEQPARPQRLEGRAQQGGPLVVADEVLGHVTHHQGDIGPRRRQVARLTEQPGDVVAPGPMASEVDAGSGRVDTDHLMAQAGRRHGEGTGAAADVDDPNRPAAPLAGDEGQVEVVIVATRVLGFVQSHQLGVVGPDAVDDDAALIGRRGFGHEGTVAHGRPRGEPSAAGARGRPPVGVGVIACC